MMLLAGTASIKKTTKQGNNNTTKTFLQSNAESEVAFPKKKKRTNPQNFSKVLVLFQSQDI